MTNALRPILFLLVLAACGGAPAPGPPAVDAGAPLPPGHPPVEGPAGAALPSGHPPIADTSAATGGARVTGTITLAPGLSVSPSDVLYVMAKSDGATLAVRRVETPSFPYDFEISGGDSMAGDASLSSAGPVDVVARVSRTGDAIPAPGDLEGTTRGVAVPATGVRLTIDSVRR